MTKFSKTKKLTLLLILMVILIAPLNTLNAQEGYLEQFGGQSPKEGAVSRTLSRFWNYWNFASDWYNRGGGISGTYASIGTISLSLTNGILNQVVYISIVKFSDIYRDSSSSINNAWRIGRDLANFCFIFILLYIAISTILDRADWKKLLARVMIIALLVNFSAVIPKIMIDASNILALTFYDNIGKQSSDQPHDLTAAFLNQVAPTPNNSFTGVILSGLNRLTGNIFNLDNWLDGTLMFILAYILLVASIMFIIRIGVLLILIILSPLAFIGWVIPSAGGYSNKWWQRLVSESIFAPAFMFILYAIIILVGGEDQNGQLSISLLSIISKNSQSSPEIGGLINFFIIVTFLTAALYIARSFSSTGAGIAIGWANKVKKLAFGGVALGAGAAGAYTLGKAARAAIKSDTFQNFAARNPFVGNLAQAGLSGVAKKKFAGATSYEERVEKTAGRIEDFKTPERKYNYLTSLGEVDRKAAYGKLTDRQKAELHEYNEDQLNNSIIPGATPAQIDQARKIHKTVNDLGPKVGTEPYEKMETERKKIRDNKNVKEALTLINPPAPATGGPPPVPTPANIQTALNTLKGKNINKLEPSVLTSPNVAVNLTSSHLAAIKDHSDITPADRDKIRDIIEDAVTKPGGTPTPAQKAAANWLNGPGGQDF